MLSTFIIAMREGLEAALIIGILLAYVVKTNRSHLRTPLWVGVSLAIALSLGLGAILSFTSSELAPGAEEAFAGSLSIVAVALVTWMVFWMKRTARTLKDELERKVDHAVGMGSIAMALTAFVAVAREGIETSLFIYTNFKTVKSSFAPSVGLILGLAAAVGLGYLMYKKTVHFDLAQFFKITGVALIVVAAGVLANGYGDLQETGWLPGAGSIAWNIDSWLHPDSFIASVLAGSIGFSTTSTWLQVGVWFLYLLTILAAYMAPAVTKKKSHA
ncbi:MAG: FTR1 family protein [Actinobacteria bacterium]|nr:FTR1 family protein [Actinomycetota bacterium]